MDLGSATIKAGFSGDSAPRAVFPAIVGRPKVKPTMVGSNTKEVFVGDEALAKRGSLKFSYPITHGIVNSWDNLEKIIHHTLYDKLRLTKQDIASRCVMVTEAPLNPKSHRERLVTMFFETFDVKCFYVQQAAVLSLYASGRTTGLVFDSGDGVSHAVPIYEGYMVPHGVRRLDLAGRDLTGWMARLLKESGYSFTTSVELEMVRDIKEKLDYVAIDYPEEKKKCPISPTCEKDYDTPDGKVLRVGEARFRCPEALFQPALLGFETSGAQKTIYNAIKACGADVRKALFSNIVLAGGSTMFPGMKERVEKEVKALVPDSVPVKVVAPHERKYSAWIGGSFLSARSTFQVNWVTKAEYEASGPAVVHRKCP